MLGTPDIIERESLPESENSYLCGQESGGYRKRRGENEVMDDKKLNAQLEQWHKERDFQRIIDAVEAIPQEQRDYKMVTLLARTYSNQAVLGQELDRDMLEKSLSLLRSVREQGMRDDRWHFHMGYVLYYLDRDEEALAYFEESNRLMPGDKDTSYFIEQCKKFMRGEAGAPAKYDEMASAEVKAHIMQFFGEFSSVYRDVFSPSATTEICIIPPSEEHDCYTLVTVGMGAHRMNVPKELSEYSLERAELVMTLPPDWKIDSKDDEWVWPFRLLESTARIPAEENTWLGWGHMVSSEGTGAGDAGSGFSGVILIRPGAFGQESFVCPLDDGSKVNFYQLLPLYQEEVEFKLAHNADELLALFPYQYVDVVNVNRPRVVDAEQKPLN